MKQHALLGLVVVGASLFAAACGGSGGNTGTGGSTATGGAGGTASTSSSSSSASSSTTTSSTSSSTSTSSSSSSSSSSSGSGTPADHLLISEIGVQPDTGGEFIEIYNPGPSAVDLSTYYLSDNSAYYGIAAGMPWNPTTSTPGTDFLAQFPAGASIAAGGVIVIAFRAEFEDNFNKKCPDYFLSNKTLTCKNGVAQAMVAPPNGGISVISDAGDYNAGLTNDREMVVLFQWDGVSPTVKDVDYVTWGTTFDTPTRIDKTGVAGYQPDTPRASQKPAQAPGLFQSIERCALETGEKLSGGNGITGHDETSEALDATFTVQANPTPGVKNTCLP